MFLFKFAQTLTIVPRVALNWYTVFKFVDFMSLFSLTKLSMENKCGIYVLQNINKNSQVVPKIFCFCIFGFTSVGLQVCVVFVCWFLNLLLMPFEVLAEFYQILVNASSTCVHYRFRCHAYLQLRQIVPKYVSVKTDDKRFREMSLKSECS